MTKYIKMLSNLLKSQFLDIVSYKIDEHGRSCCYIAIDLTKEPANRRVVHDVFASLEKQIRIYEKRRVMFYIRQIKKIRPL